MSHSISPYKVTITTTATPIVRPTTPSGVRVGARIFRNLGANSIFLGGADVTTSGTTMGWELAAGADFPDSISNGLIYGIVAAATEDIQVWEVIN